MDAETKAPAIYTPPTVPDSPMRLGIRKVLRILNIVLKALRIPLIVLVVSPTLLLIGVWSAMAIHFPNVAWQEFRTVLAWVFVGAFIAAFAVIRNRLRTALCLVGAFVVVLVWWLMLSPTHDRDWGPLAQELPKATTNDNNDNIVTISNIRNFKYSSADDFEPRYEERTYDLSKIQTLDFMICYWGKNERTAHSMLSFGFKKDKDDEYEYLCLSVEARPEVGEAYTGIGGLFKKFELIYVLGDELDLIRSRTHFRDEQVYLYRTLSRPEDVQKLFKAIMERVNEIYDKPEFYNTMTHNCTTTLAASGRKILPRNPFDIRLLLNGYADEMAYDNGWINTDDSFEATRKRHYINQYVKDAPATANFSKLIRRHLSGRKSSNQTTKPATTRPADTKATGTKPADTQ
jgi:hypothetical protein